MASRRDRAAERVQDVPLQGEPAPEGAEEVDFDRPIPVATAPAAAPTDWTQNLFGQGGSAPWDNPNPAQDPNQRRVEIAAPLAICEVAGAVQWWVERRNPLDGAADSLGTVHLDITHAEFIKRFLDSMPRQGEDPVTFYLIPMDKAGTRLGRAGSPHSIITIPWDNDVLKRLRAGVSSAAAAQAPAASGESLVLKMLQEQLLHERAEKTRILDEARAAQARADAERERAIEARMSHANMMTGDVSTAFSKINEAQQTGFSAILKTKEDLDRDDRERRREEAREERERAKEERALERDRLRVESEERLARIKAEADEKIENARIAAELRREELKLEQARIEANARREEDRRREERDAEIQRREAEREREDARREREAARDREHALSLEKMREDAMNRDRDMTANERERQREHLNLVLALIEKKSEVAAAPTSKFGVIGEMLDALGMTPGDAIEKAKGLLDGGGAAGIGVTIVQTLGDLAKEVVKRLPVAEDEEEDEDEEEADEEHEEAHEPDAPAAPAPAKPSLDAFVRGSTPALPGPTVQVPTVPVPLQAARAGREAVALLVEKLSTADATAWPVVVAEVARENPAFVEYVKKVGLRAALEDTDMTVDKLGPVLDGTGLFNGPAPREAAEVVPAGGAS